MRTIFGVRHLLNHRGNDFHYVPSAAPDPRLVTGRIGRSFRALENLPPDQGLELAEREGWVASAVILDPRHHDDGQKLYVSHDPTVGRPWAIVRALVKHLNRAYEREAYHIEVEPIFNPKTFWDFAETYKGEITSITFHFATPNMFRGVEAVEAGLRRLSSIAAQV